MFRVSAIVPILLSIAAFVLALLVTLAGKDTKFMNDVFVLRVNTSQIQTQTSVDSILNSVGITNTTTGIAEIDKALSGLSPSEVSSIVNTAAHSLGLYDYYYAHVSTWCEGTLTNSSNELVTKCTSPKFPFSFNPVAILKAELLQGITLDQLGFPTTDVNRVVNTLETAYKAMNICYLVGTILAGVSILTGATAFVASRALECVNELISLLAFLALGVASAIATTIAIKVKQVINDRAAVINVSAGHSNMFLGMTWAAVGCMFLVTMMWCCMCCCGGHRRKEHHDRNRRSFVNEPLVGIWGGLGDKQGIEGGGVFA
ncbi:hypothetical protein K440DRAFT_307711 [Wilcoxina mikolae CBS 423.85]|nr:hypothetical protein K440DRAFT_307711 [Wilcoxina mikolae CBS 423.85]